MDSRKWCPFAIKLEYLWTVESYRLVPISRIDWFDIAIYTQTDPNIRIVIIIDTEWWLILNDNCTCPEKRCQVHLKMEVKHIDTLDSKIFPQNSRIRETHLLSKYSQWKTAWLMENIFCIFTIKRLGHFVLFGYLNEE